ncbi:hypothetical protein H0H93_016284 [Arthromyces matolae]|nr:hypothetical protein H0H93_016284 [Arthromyces matolae]
MIPPRHNYTKKNHAERETAAQGRAIKREKKEQLQKDIDAFLQQREKLVVELAEKHSTDVVKVRKLLDRAFVVKQSRKPNMWNARVKHKAMELNEGRAKGDCVKLSDIQAQVREAIDKGEYSDTEDDKMIEELKNSRELKSKGARSSNRAAAVDYNGTTRRLAEELANLHERCGTMGFAFVTRGHVNDTIVPQWIESQGSLRFVNDVLHTTAEELLQKFEQWACAQDRSYAVAKKTHTIDSLRSESVNMINGGLRKHFSTREDNSTQLIFILEKLLGTANVNMSYEKYEVDIVEQYGVHLRGWPKGLKRQSPSKITNMGDARALHSALSAGECKWVTLTRQEKDARAKKRQDKIASGEIVVKKRKKRSDAGKKRGPRKANNGGDEDSDSDKENQPKAKKRKRGSGNVAAKLPPMPKSKETVDTSDSDDNVD